MDMSYIQLDSRLECSCSLRMRYETFDINADANSGHKLNRIFMQMMPKLDTEGLAMVTMC